MSTKPITRFEYEQRIGHVLRHLQGHIDEPFDLDNLASLAHFSPFHFHRIFTAMVGETVAAYQRRLRLERAAAQLEGADDQVVRVALDAGFESHEGFSRAFRTHYGCSPTEFRGMSGAERRTVLTRPRPIPPVASLAELEVRRLEPVRFAYVSRVGPYMEAGAAFGEIFAWAMPRGAWDFKSPAIGVYYDDPGAVDVEKLRFEAGLPVHAGVEGDGAVRIRIIPGGEFAVARHTGPYWRLGETYTMLYARWLPDCGREPADVPCVERYLNNPRQVAEQDLLTEVCAPLA